MDATALPVVVGLLLAVVRIREWRPSRHVVLAVSVAIGAAYIAIDTLSVAETVHFVEYEPLA